ncbi:hypothetical protein PHYPSEUDO_007741 [Phytophthora pseudosyringae]|uniref:Uncharacterized protein n=1 Tax=Phytophthora pseudosyringae TaxID=221518 RepID=A0A8T1WB45_9STRA|nr:hypothetical protein PHYPSEUDO_007741 [Phytophthora pseudosyringae]
MVRFQGRYTRRSKQPPDATPVEASDIKDTLAPSRQHEAEAKRVVVRAKQREQHEHEPGVTHHTPPRQAAQRGKRLTARQEREQSRPYGDRVCRNTGVDQRWEAELLCHLEEDTLGASDADTAIADVFAQLEEEDAEGSPSNIDGSDYNDGQQTHDADDDAGAEMSAPNCDSAPNTEPAPKIEPSWGARFK